jgi:hypothetical protein
MKRMFPLLLAVVFSLLLTACTSEPVRDVYTASGDGSRPDDLDKTGIFEPTDDLNIVVTLNAHNRELPVKAIFIAPDGSTYATDALEADETVGQVVLGLDLQMSGVTAWAEGEWSVDVYVDDQREKTVKFAVEAPDTSSSG